MEILKKLYNGIQNDYSIQRFSLGWKTIIERLDKRFKTIEKTDQLFENVLLTDAIRVAKGGLRSELEAFARELSINIETLRSK